MLYQENPDGEISVFHFDYRGSTVAITDKDGAVTDRITYGPYGEIVAATGSTATPFLYHGAWGIQTDPNGLYHMRARYYSAEIRRFVNADPIGFGGGSNWYGFVGGNPVMGGDPLGQFDAIGAYNSWEQTAVNGFVRGGILGNAQATGASAMMGVIDFFGARSIQRNAEASGTASGEGRHLDTIKYGSLAFGEILLSATLGWTGGGGAAAKGVGFKDLGWYEIGSQTINAEVFKRVSHLDKVELGKYLVRDYGWKEALFHSGPLRPTSTDWWFTLSQGPTPGGYLGLIGIRTGVHAYTAPCD